MTRAELVKFLRGSLSISTVTESGDTLFDSEYLKMTDSDIEIFLRIGMSRVLGMCDLDRLGEDKIYPVILIAKKELYHALAVNSAPLYDLSADGGGSLSKDQRFQHYMSLISEVEEEYNNYVNNSGEVTSSEVYIASRNGTRRNLEVSAPPFVVLQIDSVSSTQVELSWESKNACSVDLFISEEPFVDVYSPTLMTKELTPILHSDKSYVNKCRLKGLVEGHTYYIAMKCYNRAGRGVISEQLSFVTQDIVEEVSL